MPDVPASPTEFDDILGEHFGRDTPKLTADGVTVSLAPAAAVVSLIARKGQGPSLAARAREKLGLELPRPGRFASMGEVSLVWTGHQQWLALSYVENGSDFAAGLEQQLSPLASICDQSDARLIFRIEGPNARTLLAKGLPLDLHEKAFKVGDAAGSLYGHIGVQVWLKDASPAFELAVSRSYALSLARALLHGL